MAKSYIHQLQEIAKETGISPEIEITEIAKNARGTKYNF